MGLRNQKGIAARTKKARHPKAKKEMTIRQVWDAYWKRREKRKKRK